MTWMLSQCSNDACAEFTQPSKNHLQVRMKNLAFLISYRDYALFRMRCQD